MIEHAARDPWLVAFQLERAFELLDLAGSWPTRAGASMAINGGSRPRAQRWSRAVYDAYPVAQGLNYASSMHGNRPAVALYDRGLGALPSRPVFHRSLLDPCLLSVLRNAAWDLGDALL